MNESLHRSFLSYIRSKASSLGDWIGAALSLDALPVILWAGGCAVAGTFVLGCSPAPIPTYSLSVAVSGLTPSNSLTLSATGNGLSLSNSWATANPVTHDETISVGILGVSYVELGNPNDISDYSYSVTIAQQPNGEVCSISPNHDEDENYIPSSDVKVLITCIPNTYNINFGVSGLLPGASLVLQDNGTDNDTITANGNFTFPKAIASGSNYAVTVLSQPTGQMCTVTGGSGQVTSSVPSGIAIGCLGGLSNVGASVSGLMANVSLVLQDNAGDNLTVTSNGTINFNTPLGPGSSYAVTVLTQPSGETCSVANGTGTIALGNVTAVVTCVPSPYTVGGSVSGLLTGNQVVLQDNGGDTITVASNSSFTFPTPVLSGSTYAVTVLSQSPGQNCTVRGGSGVVAGSNVGVTIQCSDVQYNVAVTVTGLLAGSNLVLQDNGGDNLMVQGAGSPFTTNFASTVASGSPYAVTVLNQPANEGCTVLGGTGTIRAANVTVAITCTTQVASILVQPANPSVSVGSSQQFTALGIFPTGNTTDLSSMATWTSSSANVAPIGISGNAAVIAAGSTTIQAQVTVLGQPVAGATTLTGTGATTLAAIAVTPANATILPGATQQYSASGQFSNGSTLDITGFVMWSVAPNAGVVTISSSGLATGVAAGTATVVGALTPLNQATVNGITQVTVGATTCPRAPYAFPTYCGTIQAVADQPSNYTGTFNFALLYSISGFTVGNCSVTMTSTSSTTTLPCSGSVDGSDNLTFSTRGTSSVLAFTGHLDNVSGTASGTVASGAFGPTGSVLSGSFSGTRQ